MRMQDRHGDLWEVSTDQAFLVAVVDSDGRDFPANPGQRGIPRDAVEETWGPLVEVSEEEPVPVGAYERALQEIGDLRNQLVEQTRAQARMTRELRQTKELVTELRRDKDGLSVELRRRLGTRHGSW